MENRTIFLAYLVVWCAYVVATHIWGRQKRLHLAGVIASHAAPSAVAVLMTYVFLLQVEPLSPNPWPDPSQE